MLSICAFVISSAHATHIAYATHIVYSRAKSIKSLVRRERIKGCLPELAVFDFAGLFGGRAK